MLEYGPVVLYSYGLSLVVAFLVSTWLMRREALAHPAEAMLRPSQIVDLTCLIMLTGIVGGRFFFVLMHWDLYQRHPWEIPAIWHGGLIWYGGLAGGVLASWAYGRWHRVPVLRIADQIAPYTALAHAIGRIGCFLNGCCYGRPAEGWLGVQFPRLPAHVLPTQLFESLGLFLLFLALQALKRPLRPRPGRVLGAYCAGYAALRFGIEFLREQPVIWAGLTLQQLISVGMFVLGLALLLRRPREAVS